MEYKVNWNIDVDAENPVEAAKKARAAQIAPGTTANVFDVETGNPQGPERVDLTELAQEGKYYEIQLAHPSAQVAPLLSARLLADFPWLGDNDEEANGADTVDQVTDLFYKALREEAAPAQPAPASLQRDALGIESLTTGTPEQFLDAVATAQQAYWDALADLETALGFDIESDSEVDYSNETVESLTEQFAD